MKVKFTFLFSFLSFIIFGQNINQEYVFSEYPFIRFQKSINVGDKTFLAGSTYTCKIGIVTALDHDGNFLFDLEPKTGFWEAEDLVHRASDDLVIGCGNWAHGEDFYSPEDGPYFFAFDLDGNLIFERFFPFQSYNAEHNYGKMALCITYAGNILSVIDQHLLKLDTNGDLDSVQIMNTAHPFKGIETINNDLILAWTSHEFIYLDHDGQEIFRETSAQEYLDIAFDDNYIYGLMEDKIFIYDFMNNTSSTTPLDATSFENAQKIDVNSNHIFIASHGENSAYPKITNINKTDYTIDQFHLLEQSVASTSDIIATETDLQIVGRQSPYQAFIISKPIPSEFTFADENIEISDISPVNYLYVIDSFPLYPGSSDYMYVFNDNRVILELTVRNLGNAPLTSFSYRTYFEPLGICHSSGFHAYVDNINVLPNESITIIDTIGVFNQSASPSLPPLNLTFYTPNHHFEQDISDNTFSVGFTTSTQSLPHSISKFNLSPNPSSDQIYLDIQFKKQNNNIRIIIQDILRREIHHQEIISYNSELNHVISVTSLAKGQYVLSILSDGGFYSTSFVVK